MKPYYFFHQVHQCVIEFVSSRYILAFCFKPCYWHLLPYRQSELCSFFMDSNPLLLHLIIFKYCWLFLFYCLLWVSDLLTASSYLQPFLKPSLNTNEMRHRACSVTGICTWRSTSGRHRKQMMLVEGEQTMEKWVKWSSWRWCGMTWTVWLRGEKSNRAELGTRYQQPVT